MKLRELASSKLILGLSLGYWIGVAGFANLMNAAKHPDPFLWYASTRIIALFNLACILGSTLIILIHVLKPLRKEQAIKQSSD